MADFPLRVLIVADDPLARAGLAALLADQPGVTLAGRAASADDLAAAIAAHRPDVLLVDLGWNPQPTLERLGGQPDPLPPFAVLLPDAASAADAWLSGARGLLSRSATPQAILAALAVLIEGLAAIDPAFAAALHIPAVPPASRSWPPAAESAPVEELTARELEVLRLVAEGLPNKTIAARLDISEHTVKFHVNAILGKLGVASRTEAVVRATRLGLILL